MLLGNFGKEQSLFENSFVSLIYDFPAYSKVAIESLKMQICFPYNNHN